MPHLFIVILLTIAVAPVLPAAAEEDAAPLVVISAIENEHTHALAKDVIRVAYRRLGYRVLFDDLPAKRALEWADSGITDGDLARIAGTEEKYPQLIPIPVPVISFQGVVFTKNVSTTIEQWSDLAGLTIGIIRGIRYAEIGTRGMEPLLAKDMTHLFTLLDENRIDVAVAVRNAGLIEINRHFPASAIHVIGLPLYSGSLYHFVNRKNRDLVKPLAEILATMARTGELDRIHDGSLQNLLIRPDEDGITAH